ncbi:MAG: cysteine desulfurase [Candidatus Eremiobacteraeota bacterium]|nr:cysteine desulfurase [Candidatus Eremiobacteraeota bacterium]MCW5866666.1 cysteine desulfurase [Candidatus Eremiobacteraeota bacterium]
MSIYLDYAATAPLRPEVRALLARCYAQDWGNASSLHRDGHAARMHFEDARERIARVLGARVEEIIFTSGATEANNLAILGWMRQQPRGSHLIVSGIEHPSTWEAAEALTYEGFQLDIAPVDSSGRVDVAGLLHRVRANTALVSLMAVNNEVGTIQPVAELARLARGWKLHVDAVQSGLVGWPELAGIDMLSLSAHKLGGPVGSGCLFLRQGLRLAPLLIGGAQEDHRRAGTSNVIGALALAEALEATGRQRSEETGRLTELRDQLEAKLGAIDGAVRLGSERSPHISSWFFEGVRAEPLLVLFDLEGISVSSGSACSSHSVEPSRVVSAMGFSPEQARGLIRFSLGHASTEKEVDFAGRRAGLLVEKARRQGGTEN